MIRSVAAVLIGLGCILALSLAADAAVLGLFPRAFRGPDGGGAVGLLLLAITYVGGATMAGGYLTARIAPRRPILHALALGALTLALMVTGAAFTWASAPAWYHAASLALVVPTAWLGGSMRTRSGASGRWALRT